MTTAHPFPLFLPCAAGVEDLLKTEVQQILNRTASMSQQAQRGGLALMGDAQDVMRLNLHSRLCQRVLIRVSHTAYRNEQDVYDAAKAVEWEVWFDAQRSIKIDITAQHSPLKSLNFAALRVKDAVCDRFREAGGERPNVDTQHPDIRIYVHVTAEHATLYLDTSGEPLFKRGWRQEVGEAPLKETLAAAMLASVGWQAACLQGVPLYDPCCGSGTIAIEAAQIACDIAPGLNRYFAFEKFNGFDAAQWEAMRQAALQQIHPSQAPIFASDVAHRMVDFAQRNAQLAGPGGVVARSIDFRGGDALQRMPPTALPSGQTGLLLLNPPYGERIETGGFSKNLAVGEGVAGADGGADFFNLLAAHWKKHFTGWTGWVLSPDLKLPTRMRLKESRRVPLWNGPIECRLFKFEMVAGRGPSA